MGCVEIERLEAFPMVGLMEGGRDHKKRICEIIFVWRRCVCSTLKRVRMDVKVI
jgi:hypothetical protein